MGNVLTMEARAQRRVERQATVLPARLRSVSGFINRGIIANLTQHGCRYEGAGHTLRAGDRVVVSPEGLEGLCGRVCWTRAHAAGIEFERPLYGPVADDLARRHALAAPEVVCSPVACPEPLRRAA